MLVLRTIDTLHLCEGNLQYVQSFLKLFCITKEYFMETDRKLSIRTCMNICLYCPDMHILCFMHRKNKDNKSSSVYQGKVLAEVRIEV